MKNQNFESSDIENLLIRYLIDYCTDEEKKYVFDWLSQSDENRTYFNQLKGIYYLGKVLKNPSGFDKERSMNRVKSNYYKAKLAKLNRPEKVYSFKRNNFRVAVSIAASIIIILSIGLFRNNSNYSKTSSLSGVYNEISSPKGSRTHIVLPDGTKVWLNADSKIRYPMDFLNGDREIKLNGEAFFEVVKMNKKRFIVKTSDLAIKVWGTKFNVKAYPEDKIIQTTLIEGSVSIKNLKDKSSEKETYLYPSQTATYFKPQSSAQTAADANTSSKQNTTKKEVKVEDKISTIKYTSWKDDKWIIEGETLGNLSVELERRYNVEIKFENDSIKNYRFNGILKNETFEQVLDIIKFSAPVDYSIINNTVLFKINKSSKKNYDRFLHK